MAGSRYSQPFKLFFSIKPLVSPKGVFAYFIYYMMKGFGFQENFEKCREIQEGNLWTMDGSADIMKKRMRRRNAMYSRVYVEITNSCNRNCSFCHGHSRKAGKMTTEQFARVLEQLEGKTNYIY